MLTCSRPASALFSLLCLVWDGVGEIMHDYARLHGMWVTRCPALRAFARNARCDKFLAELAGNAFTVHVVGAAFIAQIVDSTI